MRRCYEPEDDDEWESHSGDENGYFSKDENDNFRWRTYTQDIIDEEEDEEEGRR
jgi:hypothetical protein